MPQSTATPEKVIDIPGVGVVAFPSSMSDVEVERAASKIYKDSNSTKAAPSVESGGPRASTAADLLTGPLKSVAEGVINLGELAYKYVPGLSTVSDAAQRALYGNVVPAEQLFEGARRDTDPSSTLEGVSKLGMDIGSAFVPGGQVSRGAKVVASWAPRGARLLTRAAVEGAGAGTIAAIQGENPTAAALVGGSLGAAGGALAGKSLKGLNAAEQAAVDFGRARGVPVPAGTATGNMAVKGAQYIADRSIGGAIVANRAQQAEAKGLKALGEELAGQVNKTKAPRGSAVPMKPGKPVTPYQAGQAVLDTVEQRIKSHADEANTAYEALRTIENSPQMKRMVSVRIPMTDTAGKVTMVRRMVPMQMPVDLRATKAALKPVYERMLRQMPVAQQRADPALHAIKNIIDSHDYMPASVIDMDLSAIKALARTEGATRTVSQGLASHAVKILDGAVLDAVQQGGSKAEAALLAGRKATQAKYLADDLLKQLRDEPRQVFDQAIWSKDAGVDRLRQLATLAPHEMPKIGRAYLDELLTRATSEGGFMRAQSLASDWQKLGPQTKSLIFRDPNLMRDLDQFFLLAKKLGENINPSGTGQVGVMAAQGGAFVIDPLTALVSQVGLAGLSKLLHSRRGVELLTEGIQLPPGSPAFTQLTANLAAHAAGN